MLDKPPQIQQWIAWLVVCIWSLMIFLTIPFARPVVEIVSERWDRAVFLYVVLSVVLITFAIVLRHVIRNWSIRLTQLLWLIVTASIFVIYAIQLSKKSPEETIHFILYGALSVLVFQALAIKRHCVTTFFAAAVICGLVGMIDEVIQWLVPQRYWDLRDVWINFFAAAIIQVAIAKGLQPTFISNRPNRVNVRFLCGLLTATAILLGACLMNTPARIDWYAERVPGLDYLKTNASIMVEYGYRYDDPDIGIFHSRFSLEELKTMDWKRSSKAAIILNLYKPNSAYNDFLRIYTPVTDPFLHEIRVHLFSRDANFQRAMKIDQNSNRYAKMLTKAFRQNQIIEKYFPHTLKASDYVWPHSKRALTKKFLVHDMPFESWVSKHLITSVTETQMGIFFVTLILGLVALNRYLKLS